MIGNIGIVGVIISIYFLYIIIFKEYNNMFKIFFITSILTTTTFINFSNNSITVPQIIALLFFIKIINDIIANKLKIYKVNIFLVVFIMYSIIIWMIKLLFNFNIIGSLSQILYLLLSVSVFYSTYILIKNNKISILDFDKAIRDTTKIIFLISFLEIINVDIFKYYFKNRIGHIFINTLENGEYRLSATFNEPSMLATFLSITLIYFTFSAFKRKSDCIYVAGIIIIGLLSKASTFILAIVIWIIIILFYLLKNIKIDKIFLYTIILIVMYIYIDKNYNNAISNQMLSLINKINGNGVSGYERTYIMQESFKLFKQNMIFGLGFGVNRSTDLFTTLLSNSGIIGFICIILFWSKCAISRRNTDYKIKSLKLGFILCLILMLVSVPEPYFNYFWIIVSFII